jgi:hypothetical protein
MQALSILFTALAILQSSYAQCNLPKQYDVGTCGDDPQICHVGDKTYGCPSSEDCISGCGVFDSENVLGQGSVSVSHGFNANLATCSVLTLEKCC